jgi:hypothetical protein
MSIEQGTSSLDFVFGSTPASLYNPSERLAFRQPTHQLKMARDFIDPGPSYSSIRSPFG